MKKHIIQNWLSKTLKCPTETKDINVLGVTIAHDYIIEKKHSSIAEKGKKVLKTLKNRNLTLIGKIQVVNIPYLTTK